MIAPLHALQRLVLSNADAPRADAEHLHDLLLLRVRNALSALQESTGAVGLADLPALLRQAVLRCHLAHGATPELRVPQGPRWPDEQTWSDFSCEVRRAGTEHFLIRPRPWTPAWLDSGAPQAIEKAIAEEPRRSLRHVLADPRVTEFTGHRNYFSPGQREAVRAAFLMPPGSTVVINLPTGAGKTLTFQLPALVFAAEGGLTVVVVPTVALARDQEDRFHKLLSEHEQSRGWSGLALAYHGGLDPESKNAIRTGIINGSVPIVFVSPEAAVGSLRGPLFAAARQGRLRVFAIDEAHIVSQWGQNFRPEFQSIAGLRDALLAECPAGHAFRTLLLTATLTTESLETLRDLFGRDRFQLVSELALRPEPAFLLNSAPSEAERVEHVLEAVRHLPRPLILYTTLREHAEEWHVRLRGHGFRRLRLVRGGDLADARGDTILRDWRNRALDIVVATSAFGLGVDQEEVRSIVHACLPESIDRYYQEVGRAGRDGHAAVALLVSTPKDLQTAATLAEEKIISVDRAFERWEAMWVRRQSGPNSSYLLSLNDRPPDLPEESDRNASWNLRTLVLMARSGLISFAAHAPPIVDRLENEDDLRFESRRREALAHFARQVAVVVRDSAHSDKRHWDNVVACTRAALRAADEGASRLVSELRDLRRPLSDVFAAVYALSDPPLRPPRMLGSCPETRRRRIVQFATADPEVLPISETAAAVLPSLEQALLPCTDSVARSWVAYETDAVDLREARRWRDRVSLLLRYAVSGGIVELSVSESLLGEREWAQLAALAPLRFVLRTLVSDVESAPFDQEVQVPRLTVLSKQDTTPARVERIMRVSRPRHVIVLPREVPDPERHYRHLFDVVRHIALEDLLSRLEA